MFFTPFNPAEIVRMEIGFFRKPLQTQTEPLPLFADGGTENNAVIRRRNSLTRKQNLPRITTPLNG
jgi:hypothetical protein